MMRAPLSTGKFGWVNKWLLSVHDWLLPPCCVLCGRAGSNGMDLCSSCASELPYIGSACKQCAIPLSRGAVCGACQKRAPGFSDAKAVFLYQEPIDFLVRALKFDQKLYCARLLGELMAEVLVCELADDDLPDVILPVPLHPVRLRQRGFNQALELARPISRRLGVPLAPAVCKRKINTDPQTGMDSTARRRNLKGVFEVSVDSGMSHIAIVDDVMTTGSTVEALAQALKAAGVGRVSVWVCARSDI
ncbi:double zinc ribbon domain-containing protein [Pseudomonadota bacterium]